MKTTAYITITIFTLFFLMPKKTNAQSPDWLWSKSFGETGSEYCYSSVIDASGNVYILGSFSGTMDFDPGPGTYNLSAIQTDIFISKLDNMGNFIWVKKIGGPDDEIVGTISNDLAGNFYITGRFYNTLDVDPGPGVYNLTAVGGQNNFICKFDSSFNLIWAKNVGASTYEPIQYKISNVTGSIYATGYFLHTVDFDPGPATFNLTAAGNYTDIFILKLDSSGNFMWAKRIGGPGDDKGNSIILDASDNVYSIGSFEGTVDFNPDTNANFNFTSTGVNGDIYTLKLDSTGNFVWAKQIICPGFSTGSSIALDLSGNVLTTGTFSGTADFDPGTGTFNLTSIGMGNMFVSKLDSAGNFLWAKNMGSIGYFGASSSCISTDASNNIYTTGYFTGISDFDPDSLRSFNLSTDSGNTYLFVCKLDSSGYFISTKAAVGKDGADGFMPLSLVLDDSGNAIITGVFNKRFVEFGSTLLSNTDGVGYYNDVFIAKLGTQSGNCSADYLLYPDALQPHSYWINNNATGLLPIHYVWSWGDGTYDTIAYPSHLYQTAGLYTICLTIRDSLGCSNNYCNDYSLARMNSNNTIISVNVINPLATGIGKINYSNSFVLFPNPAEDYLTIDLVGHHKNAEATISDITGKVIYKNTFEENLILTVNTRYFAEGIYLVQIKSEDFVETKRLVITN